MGGADEADMKMERCETLEELCAKIREIVNTKATCMDHFLSTPYNDLSNVILGSWAEYGINNRRMFGLGGDNLYLITKLQGRRAPIYMAGIYDSLCEPHEKWFYLPSKIAAQLTMQASLQV